MVFRWTGFGNYFLSEHIAYNGVRYGTAFTYVSSTYASAWNMVAGGNYTDISSMACPNLVLKVWY